MLMDHTPKESKYTDASFSPIQLMDSFCLRVDQMPRSRDVAVFVVTTTTMTDDRQTKLIALPLAHAHGVIISYIC